MSGRYGTGADVVFAGGSADAFLNLADASRDDDVRIGIFMRGVEDIDCKGRYYRVSGPSDAADGCIGMCMTSDVEGTEPSEADIAFFHGHFDRGVLMVVDPYASEFMVYICEGDSVSRAQIVMMD